jgi:hypothetical protein
MAFYRLLIIFILYFYGNKFVIGENWLNYLLQKLNDLSFYQLIIFTNDTQMPIKASIYQRLKEVIPAVNIDKYIFKDTLSYPIYKSSRRGIGFVLLYSFTHNFYSLSEIIDGLDFMVRMSHISLRPRCLIIIISDKLDFSDSFKQILKYGWLQDFLDITIINAASTNEANIYFYNPFTDIYTKNTLNEKSTLFPDKLKDMNGYFVSIPIFNVNPYLNAIKDNNGKIIQFTGLYYPIIEILSKHLNFTLKFVSIKKLNQTLLFSRLSEGLNRGFYDIIPVPIYISYMEKSGTLEMGLIYDCSKFVAVTPIIPITYVDVSQFKNLFIDPISGILLLLIIIITIGFMYLRKSAWHCIYVIGTIFGSSVPNMPSKFSERFFFISIVLTSLGYFSTIFMQMMKINIITANVPFDTIEDIINSNLTVYTFKELKQTLLESIDILPKIANLDIHVDQNFTNCLYLLKKNKNRICLISEDIAIDVKSENPESFIISKCNFFCENIAYFYKASSPYVHKFDKVILRIINFALHRNWSYEFKNIVTMKKIQEEYHVSVLALGLFMILICGYSLSILVFFFELMTKFDKKKFLFQY